MRESDFWVLVESVFGSGYARTLAGDHVLTGLDDRTAVEALEAGVPARDVWHALCDAMQVPEAVRDGGDATRIVPPRR